MSVCENCGHDKKYHYNKKELKYYKNRHCWECWCFEDKKCSGFKEARKNG